jgi:hypothetical protein
MVEGHRWKEDRDPSRGLQHRRRQDAEEITRGEKSDILEINNFLRLL